MQQKILGINGLGRIGKLTLWNQLVQGHFDQFVVHLGREVGRSIDDLVHTVTLDSTYGSIHSFLYGRSGRQALIETSTGTGPEITIDGKKIRFLTEHRNPRDIPWKREGVRLVIDCTGTFLDPSLPEDHERGSIRGHLAGGALHVIVSAPFKNSGTNLPPDSEMLLHGINHLNFNPETHRIISAASCTTTALSHMMKPLLEREETSRILTASMSTVHAATNTQTILDSVPKAGSKDMRKNRSVLNNIIITSTGAANALEQVLPQIAEIGFMADSVRIPINTVSLISLNVNFRTKLNEAGEPLISGDLINDIYREAAHGPLRGNLVYSDRQHVSADFLGTQAAAVIEGERTHCRTGFVDIPAEELSAMGIETDRDLRMPVTHSKIFGWYDNEYGYVNTLGKLAIHISQLSG